MPHLDDSDWFNHLLELAEWFHYFYLERAVPTELQEQYEALEDIWHTFSGWLAQIEHLSADDVSDIRTAVSRVNNGLQPRIGLGVSIADHQGEEPDDDDSATSQANAQAPTSNAEPALVGNTVVDASDNAHGPQPDTVPSVSNNGDQRAGEQSVTQALTQAAASNAAPVLVRNAVANSQSGPVSDQPATAAAPVGHPLAVAQVAQVHTQFNHNLTVNSANQQQPQGANQVAPPAVATANLALNANQSFICTWNRMSCGVQVDKNEAAIEAHIRQYHHEDADVSSVERQKCGWTDVRSGDLCHSTAKGTRLAKHILKAHGQSF